MEMTHQNRTYPWERFFAPCDASVSLFEDFLPDPTESKWAAALAPSVKRLPDLATVPCLVLLGGPGMGKTSTMREQYEALRAGVPAGALKPFWFDMIQFGSDAHLCNKLFGDGSPFDEWRRVGGTLHLFLDALDECQVRNVAAVLANELTQRVTEPKRLFLRISCRTARWAELSPLKEALGELWKDPPPQVLEILPLRLRDVRVAAAAHGLDVDLLIRAIYARRIAPLAAKPLTLEFVLGAFRRGTLPPTQAELYEEGCKNLCRWENSNRRANDQRRRLRPDQALAIASRIAAYGLLTDRHAIRADGAPLDEDDYATTLAIEDITGESELVGGDDVPVTPDAVREILDTDLFRSGAKPTHLFWAHETFAEHLAARYLRMRDMSEAQFKQLFMSGAGAGKLIPQLAPIALSLAVSHRSLLLRVIENEPDMLANGDVVALSDDDRERLIEALLSGYEKHAVINRFPSRLLENLGHARLSRQLRPFLISSGGSEGAREFALRLARACPAEELGRPLLTIALDATQPSYLRTIAVEALSATRNQMMIAKLRPLAQPSLPGDRQDSLKVAVLKALWPQHLPAQQLFDLLSARSAPARALGMLFFFVLRDILPHLQDHDLPIAIKWLERQDESRWKFHSEFFAEALLRRAWQLMPDTSIRNALVHYCMERLTQWSSPFPSKELAEELLSHAPERRLFLETLVQRIEPPKRHHLRHFTRRDDLNWLLGRVETEQSPAQKMNWAVILHLACPNIFSEMTLRDADDIAAIWAAMERDDVLREEIGPYLPLRVELGSEDARRRKEAFRLTCRPQQRRTKTTRQLVREALRSSQQDIETSWNRIVDALLSTEEGNATSSSGEEARLSALPGWSSLGEKERLAVVAAAEAFIKSADFDAARMTLDEIPYRWGLPCLQALALLHGSDGKGLDVLSLDDWRKWAPALAVRWPLLGPSEVVGVYRQAEKHAHHEMLEFALQQIKAGADYWIQSYIQACWSKEVERALIEALDLHRESPGAIQRILQPLLMRRVGDAIQFVDELLNHSIVRDQRQRATAISAAITCAFYGRKEGWAVVWPALRRDESLATETISQIAQEFSDHSFPRQIDEAALKELYIWLSKRHPRSTDPIHDGIFTPSLDDNVRSLRGVVLTELIGRGTAKAVDYVREIVQTLAPGETRPEWILHAEATMRKARWQPPDLGAVKGLLKHRDARLVRNADDLVQAIEESLQRLQESYIAEPHRLNALWNDGSRRNEAHPKEETALSNAIADHLRQDLRHRLIVNREAEVRAGRSDVKIELALRGPRAAESIASVVIEVKGCWHDDVRQALKTQLRDGYLSRDGIRHGIYVVGWFGCDAWPNSDRKKKRVPWRSLDEARRELQRQASESSTKEASLSAFVIDVGKPPSPTRKRALTSAGRTKRQTSSPRRR